RSGKGSERGGMLYLKPDMASLSTGSCNFPSMIYENHPSLIAELAGKMLEFEIKPEIEVFDVSMLYQAVRMAEEGQLKAPLHVQFVLGVKNAMPAVRQVLDFQVAELKRLMPEATWTAAGIGRHQLEVNRWTLELGGHCRTGLEDNIRFDKTRLALSNAELVQRLAALCRDHGRHPASPGEARSLLGLRMIDLPSNYP
ncbi:MAG: 3-keto-5-aminohexanoate cleavage protein, partial [Parvibaculaceae bacterium]